MKEKEISELDKIRMNLYKESYTSSMRVMGLGGKGKFADIWARKAVERFDEFFNKEK